MPIIVGAPRSGTTLLRLMIDAHSALAIPPETGFLTQIDHWRASPPLTPEPWLADVMSFPCDAPVFPDFGLTSDAILAELDPSRPFTFTDGIRAFYRAYAARFQKSRAGDKTPLYCFHVGPIHSVLPEARFIHLIRDGRDVAVSWRAQWFAPGRRPEDLASAWARHVMAVRDAGRSDLPILEIRYEDLVTDPRQTLRAICDFIHLPFEESMLRHWTHAERRLAEHGPRWHRDGSLVVSGDDRRRQQARSALAPSQDRIGRWRHELSGDDIRAFEATAGDLLHDLGYQRAS